MVICVRGTPIADSACVTFLPSGCLKRSYYPVMCLRYVPGWAPAAGRLCLTGPAVVTRPASEGGGWAAAVSGPDGVEMRVSLLSPRRSAP